MGLMRAEKEGLQEWGCSLSSLALCRMPGVRRAQPDKQLCVAAGLHALAAAR